MAHRDFSAWMTQCQHRIEAVLEHMLPPATEAPTRLHDAMRYAVLGGGKRVRPLLAYAAGEAVGAAPERVDQAAAAVELIHVYSLVHDDMPCMDNDVLRRGKPTCHVQYDDATALLVGDALQTLAFEALCAPGLTELPHTQLGMVQQLARASGSRGMAGGQAIDLASVGHALTLPELEFMHLLKTGALIRASIRLGAACGPTLGVSEDQLLDRFAKCVGLAFQVVDDILDSEADTATLGKTAGKDADHHKPTYVSLMGLSDAKRFADDLLAEADSTLAPLGDSAARLRQLGHYIVTRKF